MLKIAAHLLVIVILTVLTQIGGVLYLLVYIVSRKLGLYSWKRILIFLGAYILFATIIIPHLAPVFGRKPLPLSGNLSPVSYLTCLLNRHYVSPELYDVLVDMSANYHEEYGVSVNYLDGNFPFFNGFPLMPHLSHNDGKKVDLAFSYNDAAGQMTEKVPSWIGYGVYDEPRGAEVDYPEICAEKGYWQYGLLKWITPANEEYVVDTGRTSWIVTESAQYDQVSKIFIEPHLKERWGFANNDKVRFHGCGAVRHDDHIHLQIK